MTNKILIFPDRQLFPEREYVGIVGENNAEKLIFRKPAEINGRPIDEFTMRVIFNNKNGSYVREVDAENSITLNTALTVGETLTVIVQFLYTNIVKWSSAPLTLYLRNAGDDSGEHSGNDAETMLADFVAALNAMCGDPVETIHFGTIEFADFSTMTYEELLDYLTTIKNFVATALEKVNDGISGANLWTLAEILQSLYDFAYDEIRNIEDGTLDIFRNKRGIGYDEFMQSDFARQLIESRSNNPYWAEIFTFVSAVLDRLEILVDADNLEAVEEHFEEVYGGNWHESSWRSLFGLHNHSVNQLYVILYELTGVQPETYSEFYATYSGIKSIIVQTIAEKLGTEIDDDVTLDELMTMITEMRSGGQIEADNISVPFSYTENGVTTNLEFTVIDGNPVIKEMEE